MFTHDDDGFCQHGYPHYECEECDAVLEAHLYSYECLNCGRYKSGNQLNADQVCKAGCINPNEY